MSNILNKYLILLYSILSTIQCLIYKQQIILPNGTETYKSCNGCTPGQKLGFYCNLTHVTKCLLCPLGQYQDNNNISPNCKSCTQCKFPKEEISSCSSTHNTVCGCKNGYYSKNNECIKCSVCYLGEGTFKQCGLNSDTICKVCSNSTFSDVISSDEPCKLYQNCTKGTRPFNLGLPWYDKFCFNCTIFNATTDLNKFTRDFILYNYYTLDQLKKLVRLTFSKTRNDVVYASRSMLESMFQYNVELPNYLSWSDLSGTSTVLLGYYNTLREICLSTVYYQEA